MGENGNPTQQKNVRLAQADREILRRAVDEGIAINETDALRMAIRLLGDRMETCRKIAMVPSHSVAKQKGEGAPVQGTSEE